MRFITTLLFLFCSLICDAQISGLFMHIREGGYSSLTICLNQDGTYKYVDNQHLADFSHEGHYKMSGDTITLNSNYQIEDIIKVKKWNIAESDSIYISIITHNDFPLLSILVNDSLEFDIWQEEAYPRGILTFKRGLVRTIRIKPGGHVSSEIFDVVIEPGNDNMIELFINDFIGIHTTITKNEKWLYRKTGLVLTADKRLVLNYIPDAKCN